VTEKNKTLVFLCFILKTLALNATLCKNISNFSNFVSFLEKVDIVKGAFYE